MFLRLVIYGIIFGAIYFGLRRIVKDWRQGFRDLDKKKRERDLKDRERPGIVELEQDKDGVFRPRSGRDKDGQDSG